MRLFLEVAEQLGYEDGKVRLVLNRADSALGIRVADVEHSIGRKVDETIVSDGRSVVYALNRGVPFFLSNREAQVSQDILRLARSVVGERSARRQRRQPASRPRRNRCSHGAERDHSRPLGARRGVGDVPAEADRERSTGRRPAPGARRARPGPTCRRARRRRPPSAPTPGRLTSQAPGPRVVPGRQVPDPEPGHPGPGPEARPVQPGRGPAPDRGDLRQGHRRGRPRPDPRRARPDARADHRRDHRPRPARAAPARRVASPRSWSTARARSTSSAPASSS